MVPAHLRKISAIIPNYNDAVLLPKALESLVNQTDPLTEIIVVDDGSTDNSINVIQDFMSRYNNIRLIQHEKNQGVCAALNTGIEQATGDYVMLCAADDWYADNMIALAKQVIRHNPRIGLICGDAMVTRFDMRQSFKRTLPYQKKNSWITPEEFQQLAKKGYVGFNGGGGMLMKRQAVLEAGLLYPELRWHCDWLLYFAVAMQHGIYYIDEVFVHINMRKTSYSEGKNNRKVQKQVMIDTINVIYKQHPELWDPFREGALLPNYSIRYLPLFLFYPVLRQFLTPRLVWKFIINNRIVVKIGRLFPYRVILEARKLLKA